MMQQSCDIMQCFKCNRTFAATTMYSVIQADDVCLAYCCNALTFNLCLTQLKKNVFSVASHVQNYGKVVDDLQTEVCSLYHFMKVAAMNC